MESNATNLRKIVIEDSSGRAVRVFLTNERKAIVAQNLTNNRIEVVGSTATYIEQEIPFIELGSLSGKAPVQLTNGYVVRTVDVINDVSEDLELPPEEDEEKLRTMLRFSAIAHILLLVTFLSTWLIYDKWLAPETAVEVVTITPKERIDTPKKEKTKTVTARRKIVKPRTTKTVSKRRARTNKVAVGLNAKSRHRAGTGKRGSPNVNIKNSQIFDTLSKYNRAQGKSGGLNLAADPSKAQPGWGRGSKSGIHSTNGVGLVIGPGNPGGGGGGGSGAGAGTGATGYNTRGRAGGNNGFGNISMKGSAKFSVTAIEDEALIDDGGGLTAEQIDAVIRRNLGQVRACYERGLQTTPSLKGRVSISFVIGGSGRVNTSRVSHTSLDNSQVEGCINQRLRSWKFPRPVGNVDVKVSYPFVLGRVSRG